MKEATLRELHCPYCDAHLELIKVIAVQKEEIIHAILKCNCRRYPLVEGILVLKTLNPSAMNQALLEMERSKSKEALLWLLEPRTTFSRIIQAAKQRGLPFSNIIEKVRQSRTHCYLNRITKSDSFSGVVDHIKSIAYGGYFKYRFSNTSFIAGIPLILLMHYSQGPILEIGCGMGHHGFVISQLYPQRKLVLTDFSFVNLYLAKRFFVPDAEYICLDANELLPFPDRNFAAIFTSDAFHYLHAKKIAIQEIARLSSANTVILLSHLHNLNGRDPTPGEPLTASGWLNLCAILPQSRLLPETRLFQDFLDKGRLDLFSQASQENLKEANAFSLIGTFQPELFRIYEGLNEQFFSLQRHLTINPLYRISSQGDGVCLQKNWPSQFIQNENIEIDKILPDTFSLDKQFLKLDTQRVDELMRQFILLNTPKDY